MRNFNFTEERLKGFQKVVKYVAIGLAIGLAASIILGIVDIVGSIFGTHGTIAVGDMRDYEISGEISDLDIDISAAELIVSSGDSFSVRSNLKNLKVGVNGGKLVVEDKTIISFFGNLGNNYNGAVLEITLPRNFVFDKVEIETGAGRADIERLAANEIKMSLGAGQVDLKELIAYDCADIDGGAGELNILSGSIKDFDFDMGVGEFNIEALLLGNCDFDMGVGEANITLLGSSEDYRIDFSKGLGSIDFNGVDVKDGSIIGYGDTLIDISGGVGAINVKIKNAD